jgi:hypothetical protein
MITHKLGNILEWKSQFWASARASILRKADLDTGVSWKGVQLLGTHIDGVQSAPTTKHMNATQNRPKAIP